MGADTILNRDDVSGDIDGGPGDDSITHSGSLAGSLFAGDGADSVTVLFGGDVNEEVDAGEGANVVYISGNIEGGFVSGSGDDSVWVDVSGEVEGDLNIGSGANTVTNEGQIGGSIRTDDAETPGANDRVVNLGSVGDDIQTGGGNDTVENAVESFVDGVVDTGSGDDNIAHAGAASALLAGDGADRVVLSNGARVSGVIDGGANAEAGDVLAFSFIVADEAEVQRLIALLQNASPANGSIAIAGASYVWQNFEQFDVSLTVGEAASG